MMVPPFLSNNATIAVAATARYADEKLLEDALLALKNSGYRVVVSPLATTPFHRFAGDDASRVAEFNRLLNDPEIDAIWLVRGGYGTLRILDTINWDALLRHPKWLIGFSDFTLVHCRLQHLNMASVHACTFSQLSRFGLRHENVISALELISGEPNKYTFSAHPFNRHGSATGSITGGNLSLICNTIGTSTQPDTRGRILVLEDCDEYMYHYDRMLRQMKRAGMLQGLAGLIIGSSTFKPEPDDIPFGFTLEEIVMDCVKEYSYPVCFEAPFGHTDRNYALMMNTPYTLHVTQTETRLHHLPVPE